MGDRMRERMKQLKFIASMFQMGMDEIRNVMGEESVQVVYRLLGERVGKEQAKKIGSKDPTMIANKLLRGILEPALGKGNAEVKAEGNEISVVLKVCPFQNAGIDISPKFYCMYTQGMLETAIKESVGDIEFESLKLRAIDNCDCSFKIKIK